MSRLAPLTAALALLAGEAAAQTNSALVCNVSATGLAFGTFTGSRIDNTGVITLACVGRSNDSPYAVSISEGSSNDFLDRRMTNGRARLSYNLYLDPGRTVIWGNGRGATQQHVGNFNFGIVGSEIVRLTVYGRIPAQPTPAQGAYTDTLLVVLTF